MTMNGDYPYEYIGRKERLKECVFVNSAFKLLSYCQKYTLTDCFFGDFGEYAHTENVYQLFEMQTHNLYLLNDVLPFGRCVR